MFVVVKGEIRTPPLAAGCLAGITHGLVLEWTKATETDLPYQALFDADEVFLTSSMRDVQAVTRIDGRPVGIGAAGPVTKDVRATFQARAAQDPDPR